MIQKPTLIGLGEILWDVYPDGPRFGGAPANFACSAASLARERVNISIVSAVGRDELGQAALEALRNRQVNTEHVAIPDRPTGQVTVKLDDEGRATYEFATDTAWDNLEWSSDLEQLASKTDALCFGTLGQRSECSRKTIQQFVSSTPSNALRILDVNLRPPFVSNSTILESLELANILKLNDEELPLIATLCDISGSDIKIMQQLATQFELQVVALTRGPDGALLIRGDKVSDQSAFSTQVVDTVGAGDAFTATLAVGLLDDDGLDTINHKACAVAAYVCSQNGATPDIPDNL
ncbi:MAG: carbohydrate kinase [Verrucomicrobia bacterium]|nr:carbohydrate kinase [Verrucomicrobiota bacterium]